MPTWVLHRAEENAAYITGTKASAITATNSVLLCSKCRHSAWTISRCGGAGLSASSSHPLLANSRIISCNVNILQRLSPACLSPIEVPRMLTSPRLILLPSAWRANIRSATPWYWTKLSVPLDCCHDIPQRQLRTSPRQAKATTRTSPR